MQLTGGTSSSSETPSSSGPSAPLEATIVPAAVDRERRVRLVAGEHVADRVADARPARGRRARGRRSAARSRPPAAAGCARAAAPRAARRASAPSRRWAASGRSRRSSDASSRRRPRAPAPAGSAAGGAASRAAACRPGSRGLRHLRHEHQRTLAGSSRVSAATTSSTTASVADAALERGREPVVQRAVEDRADPRDADRRADVLGGRQHAGDRADVLRRQPRPSPASPAA